MDLLWNLGAGLLVAAVIPLLVPIRHGSAPLVLVVGVLGAVAMASVGRWLELFQRTNGVLGLFMSVVAALLALVVYAWIGKRWPERSQEDVGRGPGSIHIHLTR